MAAIREAAPGLPIGVSTGEWIESDLGRRLAAIRSWDVRPDFASVNFSEPGALEVCRVLGEIGVGIEVGLSSEQDTARFLAHRVAHVRILLEPGEPDGPSSLANVQVMLRVLDTAGISSERLVHGQEGAAWPVLAWAVRRGLGARIGFEDVLLLPDGKWARDNAALFAAARVHG